MGVGIANRSLTHSQRLFEKTNPAPQFVGLMQVQQSPPLLKLLFGSQPPLWGKRLRLAGSLLSSQPQNQSGPMFVTRSQRQFVAFGLVLSEQSAGVGLGVGVGIGVGVGVGGGPPQGVVSIVRHEKYSPFLISHSIEPNSVRQHAPALSLHNVGVALFWSGQCKHACALETISLAHPSSAQQVCGVFTLGEGSLVVDVGKKTTGIKSAGLA